MVIIYDCVSEDSFQKESKMTKSAFLFPGQGSQSVGMVKDFYNDFSQVREVFEAAEEVSKIDIANICFNGPMEELTQTITLQPAITVANIACLLAVKTMCSHEPDISAGHSLGEYSALYQAGVISLEDTFRLVLKRGQLMQRESEKYPGKMSAILKLSIDTVQQIVDDLKGEGVISIANYNSESQIVISGKPDLIKKASKKARKLGGVGAALNVSGAWHSDLIKGAQRDFQTFLDTIVFNRPNVPIVFNVTGEFEQNPENIKVLMKEQLCRPVKWHDSVIKMVAENIHTFVEIGPGKVLAGLLNKIIPEDYSFNVYNINDMNSLDIFCKENF